MDEQKTPVAMTTEELLKEQLELQKKQYRLSMITTVCAVAVLIITIGTAFMIGSKVNDIYNSSMVTIRNLEKITTELSATNFTELMESVSKIVTTSEDGIADALEQINSIDIESLNASIRSLRETVEPLAAFFSALGRR